VKLSADLTAMTNLK